MPLGLSPPRRVTHAKGEKTTEVGIGRQLRFDKLRLGKRKKKLKKLKKKLKKEQKKTEKVLKRRLKEEKRRLKRKRKEKIENRKSDSGSSSGSGSGNGSASGSGEENSDRNEQQPSTDIPLELMEKSKAMAPMTKEEWEKRQSVVRRVLDEETGRHRLIKGDGEVIEEIVSRERHRQINRQATQADGAFYQGVMNKNGS
ncbi:hypothetical protein O3G_MSEX003678 [Manduca sexta]|uniref:ADP-ribosylation factor-like protein 6-interacting protein 4 n=1 Tax=Manduca sexta TaxID=7130 RepID=A0A922CGF8_MANSE|nr:hypothetical protein O3G_MSEX003678 [Manduca sexta]